MPPRASSPSRSDASVETARHTQSGSHAAAARLVAVTGPPPNEDAQQTGVYVLLNGLLCRTADKTGRFSPSDVFAGVSHDPARASLPVPSLASEKDQNSFLRDAADTATTARGFDVDCPIFNTFGVMTGGVLINPFDDTFVDYTQRTPYTVAGPAPSRSCPSTASEAHSQSHCDAPMAEVHAANELAFRRGDFSAIRPTAALTLCTSELALPPPAPMPCTRTTGPKGLAISEQTAQPPLSSAVAHAKKYSKAHHHDVTASAWAVEQWYNTLALPPDLTAASARRHKSTWSDAEALRPRLQHSNVLRATQAASSLRPAIPFLYRDHGLPLPASPADHFDFNAEANADNDLVDVPDRGVRCGAASFVCYSGDLGLIHRSANPARETSMDQRVPSLTVRLQKRLRPYSNNEIEQKAKDTSEAESEMLHKRAKHVEDLKTSGDAPPSSSAVPAAITGSEKDISKEVEKDVLEYFLIPYSSDRPRSAAYLLFSLYFNHLGLLCNGVRLTGETAATSAPRRLRAGRCTWDLCPASVYDVAAEVQRKRKLTRALWSDSALTFPGGSRWSTTASNKTAVSDAFNALMIGHRDVFLHRILELNAHLHSLAGEGQQPL